MFETDFLPSIPPLSDPTRVCMMATTCEFAAREFHSVPRPQDGTLDFSIEHAFLAAEATKQYSARKFSTATSFITVVSGSDAAACTLFPTRRAHDGIVDCSIAPALPAAVATHDESAENSPADANFNTTVGGEDALNKPSSTGDAQKPTTLAVSTQKDRRHRPDGRRSIGPFLWLMLALPALLALGAWRATP